MIKLISSSRSGRPLRGAPATISEREKQVILQKASKQTGIVLYAIRAELYTIE